MPVKPILPDISPLFREKVRSAVRVFTGEAGETFSRNFAFFAKKRTDDKVVGA